ncbi:MAG: phosphogluconate dehydrogenase (NAD(+)-dependent, decarboxylating), partial [Anaerolineales bacterium]
MELGMVGLGKMGANMARRLLQGGHRVVGYDPRAEAVEELMVHGAEGARSLDELVGKLPTPRTVWVMVPSGRITDETISSLCKLLAAGDTVIDGGNSNYKHTQRRAESLRPDGIHFIDVGTSGGVWGLAEGYSMMVGGDAEVVARHGSIFETLAPGAEQGWGHVGPNGAGHFVKMVHNGIEYGLMQAYAEGFELMRAKEEFGLSLHQIAEIWRYGSVVRSWLLDLAADALEGDENLTDIAAWVPDSGEGRWTVVESIDLNVPTPVITAALQRRFRSRQEAPFADKLLAALRNQFGGHAVKR